MSYTDLVTLFSPPVTPVVPNLDRFADAILVWCRFLMTVFPLKNYGSEMLCAAR